MILEVAILQVKPGLTDEFEHNFKIASGIISKMKGYINHELKKCIEDKNKYIFLVRWETLEDHMVEFRNSDAFVEWRRLASPFFAAPPRIEHLVVAVEGERQMSPANGLEGSA